MLVFFTYYLSYSRYLPKLSAINLIIKANFNNIFGTIFEHDHEEKLTTYELTMVEFKFTAQKPNGQTITGMLTSITTREGKEKIQKLAEKNQVKIFYYRY